jgi:hypothetical protein
MLKAFLTVTAVLSLSAATATAEPAQAGQQMHLAPTHLDIGSSLSRSTLTSTNGEHQASASGKQAAQSADSGPEQEGADSDPEPESISGGTEP